MTDLHWALLALGIVIIIAVLAFNWFQERKFRKEAAERFVLPDEDVLMDEFQFDTSRVLDDEPVSKIEPIFQGKAFEEIAAHFDNSKYDLNQPVIENAPTQIFVEKEPAPATEILLSDAVVALQEETNAEARLFSPVLVENSLDNSPIEEDPPYQKSKDETPEVEITLPDSINPLIDLIAVLYLPKSNFSAPLKEFLLALTDMDKPIFSHVLTLDQTWHLISRDYIPETYKKVACSVQLADRSGYISKNSLSRFQHEVDKLANKLGAQVEWQTIGDAWRYASELDQFCIDVDKTVGFHLNQGINGPFTGTKFRGLAEANGLTLHPEGHYFKESDKGLVLYTVHNIDKLPFSVEMLRTNVIRGVTFKLDIPRVKNCPEVFNQMAVTGQLMANNLAANFVDDNQRPVGETQLEIVRHQLRAIHAKMVARGIVPGSPSALRLFS